MLDECKDTYLVEDNPNFSNFKRIILLDKSYNSKVKDATRILPYQLIGFCKGLYYVGK